MPAIRVTLTQNRTHDVRPYTNEVGFYRPPFGIKGDKFRVTVDGETFLYEYGDVLGIEWVP